MKKLIPSFQLCASLFVAMPCLVYGMELPRWLSEANVSFRLPHQARPAGVPSSYDWASAARPGRMNDAGSFRALTGWGQVHEIHGYRGEVDSTAWRLELKNFRTYICSGVSRKWTVALDSRPTGAYFRADFAGNQSSHAKWSYPKGLSAVPLATGALHFWHGGRRARLPDGPICGVLVVAQARIKPSVQLGPANKYLEQRYVLSLGADYWKNESVEWDNYRTNKDVGIGRFMLLTSEWQWYAMSTSGEADLEALMHSGLLEF